MKLIYFYDEGLPSRNAAWIQIFQTCRALAALDVDVEIVAGKTVKDFAQYLATFGIDPHPNLRLSAVSPEFLERPAEGADILMSRDNRGIRLFSGMPPARKPGRAHKLIHEAHRVAFINRSEKGGEPVRGFTRNAWNIRLAPLLRRTLNWRVLRLRIDEARTVSRVDGIVALNSWVDRDLRRFFPHNKPVLILPSGVDMPSRRPPLREGRDLDIVYAGKLLRRKGFFDLLRAMTYLPDRRLTVLGGDDDEIAAMERRARELQLCGRVDFRGFMPPRDVRNFMVRARVAVCPAAREISSISARYTSPLKIVESWAAGTPLVAAETDAVLAMVRPGENARLYPPGDPKALALEIQTLLHDPELSERLATRGFEAARAHAWDRRAMRLKSFLESFVDGTA